MIRWYRRNRRPLPWRQTKDPYRIWVSEVMLQQTTVQTILPRYQQWLKAFPDIQTLARAPLQKVLKAWQGLGYYERARNMRLAARMVCDRFNGSLPVRYKDLISLPGFGPYTTAAVLSIAFGQSYPVLDANVRRVLMRLAGTKSKENQTPDKSLLSFLSTFFPRQKAGEFNQAMMELGALVCKPRNPFCPGCPVQDFCLAFKKGEQELIPAPRARRSERIETVVAIIKEDGKYLIQRRPAEGLLAGLWEFPGGKRKPGETLEEALRREIREELGSEIKIEKLLLKVNHAYTRFQVILHAYECRLKNRPQPGKRPLRWVPLRSLRNYPFPSGNAKIINYLEGVSQTK
ncbi:MAG: A/G-specific adenine glycosylase [Clostridiales bacterium]|nr:A/G-specific adenine glycosylase [Clostridiales bacterium]